MLSACVALAVYGWMLERMPTMRNIQVCNALFAMGKLNLYNAELCDALLQVRSSSSGPGRSGQGRVPPAAVSTPYGQWHS